MASLVSLVSLQTSCTCADCGVVCEPSAVTKLNCLKHFICNIKCLSHRVQTPGAKKDILTCSLCYDFNTSPGIYIFVDDSNIWIEAKKLQSKLKHYKTVEDHRVRIDVGKLTDVLAAKRTVDMGVLYGSEPPPVDTVWTKIKEQGWRVEKDKRHALTGKEKKVDTRLVAEATALAVRTPIDERTTIVFVTGDADVIPAIDQIMKEAHWKVEVCMWKHAMSRDIDRYAKEHPERVQIKHLDDFLNQVSFTNKRFDIRNPRIRHLVSKGGVVFSIKDKAFPKRVPTQSWLNQLESIAQWPYQYYWFESHKNGKTNDLVVVFKADPKAGDFDITQFISDIESKTEGENKKYRLPSTTKVQPFLQYMQSVYKKPPNEDVLKFDAALEQVGVYDNEEAIEEDVIFESDPYKDWQTYRRQLHSHRLRQQYSENCPYQYNCKFGTRCQYQHSEDEKTYFRGRIEGRGNPLRKVSSCRYFDQVPPSCLKMKKDCEFAHGDDDAWCLDCLSPGHFTEQCPKQKDLHFPELEQRISA